VFIDHAGPSSGPAPRMGSTPESENRPDPHVTQKDGLPKQCDRLHTRGSRSRLWISTTNGLSRFDPRTAEFALPAPTGFRARSYGYSACYRALTGDMYFGGFAGAVSFSPQSLTEDTYEPAVVLTGLELNVLQLDRGRIFQQAITHARHLGCDTTRITSRSSLAA